MARNINNILTRLYGGKFADKFVFRNVGDDTFITKYPDRSNVILSHRQRQMNSLFTEAIAYAQSVLADPLLTAEMKKKLKTNKKTYYKTVYNACIQQFMKDNSLDKRVKAIEELIARYRATFDLTERQSSAVEILILNHALTNSVYQHVNKVSKITATRDLKDLVSRGIIAVSGWGAGTKYALLPLPGDGQ